MKDYLRELPEPLLTSQAYQVAERALTKDTTQDADLDSMEVVNEFVAKLQPRHQVVGEHVNSVFTCGSAYKAGIK